MGRIHNAAGDSRMFDGYPSDYSILYRFLRSRVGRPWDDVYSEICAEADGRSHDGYRFRQSVLNVVETDTRIDEQGDVANGRGTKLRRTWGRSFYVHPETGVLEYANNNRRVVADLPRTVFESEGRLYHQHEGVWYEVTMTVLSQTGRSRYFWYGYSSEWVADAFGALDIDNRQPPYYWHDGARLLEQKYGRSPEGLLWYCSEKRSAHKREIRRLKRDAAA